MSIEKYIEGNREAWNKRSPIHYKSEFYDIESFIAGRSSLNWIELAELGDLRGKKILHLQCHFGQDTLSLERLGAEVVGVDLSDVAIEYAEELREKCGLKSRFIQSDIYELKSKLDEKFDLVFTSYGVVGWLPDLGKWAEIISHYLKPSGEFYIAEFHPIVWTFDYEFEKIAYSYNKKDVIIEDLENTYADRDQKVELRDFTWNHGLNEVINSLINAGLEIKFLNEHEESPYQIFNDGVEVKKGRYCVKGLEYLLPLVYSIKAVKK